MTADGGTSRKGSGAGRSGVGFGAPISVPSRVDIVVERLRDMITMGVLRCGDTLPSERVLTQEVGASRNVVREALGILRIEGLIEVRAGKGSIVASPGAEQASRPLEVLLGMGQMTLIELGDVRAAIEPRIARLAAERATPAQLGPLEAVLKSLEASQSDSERHVELDITFHRELALVAAHRGYEWIIDAVRLPMRRSMTAGTRVAPSMATRSDVYHRRVVEAVARGDADGAETAMKAHMDHIAEYLRKGDKRGWWDSRA